MSQDKEPNRYLSGVAANASTKGLGKGLKKGLWKGLKIGTNILSTVTGAFTGHIPLNPNSYKKDKANVKTQTDYTPTTKVKINELLTNNKLISIITPYKNDYLCIVAYKDTVKIIKVDSPLEECNKILSINCDTSTDELFVRECKKPDNMHNILKNYPLSLESLKNIMDGLTKVIYLKPRMVSKSNRCVIYDFITHIKLDLSYFKRDDYIEDKFTILSDVFEEQITYYYNGLTENEITDLEVHSKIANNNPVYSFNLKTLASHGNNIIKVTIPFAYFKVIVPYIGDDCMLNMDSFFKQFEISTEGGRSKLKVPKKTVPRQKKKT